MLQTEIWKDINGYEGLYQISDLGRIKGLYYKNNKILKQHITNGYHRIVLHKNKKNKNYRVHRLIAEAFIPNPDNKPCINHKDGDKANNNINNLEWCTYSENGLHAYETGLHKPIKHSKRVIEIIRQANLGANNHNYNKPVPIETKRKIAEKQQGELGHNAKLKELDIRDIKDMFDSGIYQKEIGALYGISQQHISRIINNKRWKHIK